MDHYHFLKLLFLPSMLSGIIIGCLTAAIVITSGVLYVTENQLFYDYLFGVHGINTVLLQSPDSPSAMWSAISSSSFAYYVLLFAISLIAGLTIWVILQGIMRIINEAAFALSEVRLAQKEAIQEMFQRLTIRVLALITAALYIIFFVNVLVPFIILLLQNGIEAINISAWPESVGYVTASGILLALGLHINVVFARLYTLRLRIFGGPDVQLALLDQHNLPD